MADGDGVTLRAKCMGCGEPAVNAKPDEVGFTSAGPCLNCGSEAVHLDVGMSESISVYDEMRYLGTDTESGRTVKGKVVREMTEAGPLAGTLADVEQMVDRINRRYSKKVTLSDGTVVKDVTGSLDDQTLHGRPQQQG